MPKGILETSVVEWTSGLQPGRAEIALNVFRAVKNLPILDIHTHYPADQIVSNTPWKTPAELFLGIPNAPGMGFDHYAATVMLAQGVNPDLVYGRRNNTEKLPSAEFERARFNALVAALAGAYPNPTSQWFELALQEVFKIDLPLDAGSADAIYDAISVQLKTKEFFPRELLIRHGIRVALTTDSPADSLEHHRAGRAENKLQLVPTWRPDPIFYPEPNTRFAPGNFKKFVGQICTAAQKSVEPAQLPDFAKFLDMLKSRLDFFGANGCRAADFGIENFPHAVDCVQKIAAQIYQRALAGEIISSVDADQWKGFMLTWFCKENARRGWGQYFHQGAARNLNTRLREAHGADAGGDGPGEMLDRRAFTRFLDNLNSAAVEASPDGTGLAKTVVFPINPEDFTFALDTAARFNGNSAGIRSKVQVGPPWWFNDTVDGNRAFIRLSAERGVLENWVGMLSDARCLPSVIARFGQFRAILAAELVKLYPRWNEKQITELARRICHKNAARFLGGFEDLA